MIYTHTRIFLPTTSGCAKLSLEVEIAVFFCVSEDKIFFVSSLEEAGQVAKIDWVSYQGKWGEWGKWRISDTVIFLVGACNCISQSLSQSISQWLIYRWIFITINHHHHGSTIKPCALRISSGFASFFFWSSTRQRSNAKRSLAPSRSGPGIREAINLGIRMYFSRRNVGFFWLQKWKSWY